MKQNSEESDRKIGRDEGSRDDWGNTRRMTGENGNGELVIFEFDESGEVVRLKMGDNYAYPVNK